VTDSGIANMVTTSDSVSALSDVTITSPATGEVLAYNATNAAWEPAALNHDSLTGYVADEHIDWTADQGTTNIDSGNVTDLTHGGQVDNPSSGVHGVTGDVVGTSDSQTLTNKTIDADLNTISNLAASDVTDFDTEVGNQADVAANTSARHSHANKTELDLVTDGDHDVRTDNPHSVTAAQAGAARSVDIQEFTSDGSWTKPTNAKRVHVLMWGGGGGGGSGAGDSATFDSGGGGGAGAVGAECWWDADDLSSSETVTVGAAGAGGAAVTYGGGNAGVDGGDTDFNGVTAKGGNSGSAGSETAGAGGTIKIANSLVISGPYGLPTDGTIGGNAAAAPTAANKHSFGGGGGGGGGGNNPQISTDFAGALGGGPIFNTVTTGSGGSKGVANGGNGGNGAAALSDKFAGSGGGGGGGNYDGAGGDGGDGGLPGGGGGGGGAGYSAGSGVTSGGAGGAGGSGLVRIITYF
jgi:hypothetical protein